MFKLLGLLTLFVIPALASAHTKWFMTGELDPFHTTEPTLVYLALSFCSVLLVVVGAIWLHRHNIGNLKFLRPKKSHAYERAASTFTMMIGSFLLIAGTHEYLFSPNLTIHSGVAPFLIAFEIGIGLAFLLGIFTRVSAILLSLVWFVAVYYSGWLALMENVWVLSTAVFILVMGNDYFSLVSFSLLRKKVSKYKKQALSILRIGMGVTLVILGFSEKILAPGYGLHFLEQHHWNFMSSLGFNYSDYLFTLSAGSVEILIGVIFILGVATRLTAVIAIVVFTIPLFILGPIELAGHLPHFAAMFLLVFLGSGGRYSFFKQHKDEVVKV
ncbi:MAG: DoxX family protein [Candidatus Paceibacterota bacterium]